MNEYKDIYGKYSLIPLLTAIEELNNAQSSCLEQIHYYEEAMSYGELSIEAEKINLELELQVIRKIKFELEHYLIPLSN